MQKEKSQFENIVLPPAEEGVAKKNAGQALPADFSLGKELAQEQSVPRAESVKSFVPSFQSQEGIFKEEERKLRARLEKEGMNYDLYLLINGKLVGEFQNNLEESEKKSLNLINQYQILKQSSLEQVIKTNPELYTPNPKDLEFIAKNLREFFPELNEDKYLSLGAFLNTFIHAYFDSVPQEERKNLKLFIPNTKDLNFIGAELSFGELEVEEAGGFFGREASGNAVLKAQKVGNDAGWRIQGSAKLEVVTEAGSCFGQEASGNAVLKAQEAGGLAGWQMQGSAKLEVDKAGRYFGREASGKANLKAQKVGDDAGKYMQGDARLEIAQTYNSIGDGREGNSQIILPDGRILKARDTV